MAKAATDYKIPVWGTQGGGLVIESSGQYVFTEAPGTGMGLDLGDVMPDEWGLIPANDLARAEMERN